LTLIILVFAILIVLGLILAECPIALALLTGGAVGILLTQELSSASAVLANIPYSASSSYELFVIPMYILLGALLSNAGIGEQIYRSVHRWTHKLPGGLAISAVGATALFSGISGSSAADVAAFGRISVSEMTRYGYSKGYAAAVVAAAGTFANLIPPSLGIVVYGIVAKESIGKLILAGVVPGILSMVILAMFVFVRAAGSPAEAGRGGRESSAPLPPSELTTEMNSLSAAAGSRSWLLDGLGVFYGALIFTIAIGGLYGGFFTPTESGAVSAFAALLIAGITPRSVRRASFGKVIWTSLIETSQFTSMIFLLLIGGAVFSYFLAAGGYATDLAVWATGLRVPPRVLVALILLLLLPLGMLLEGLAILLLAIPIFAPIVTQLGFSGVWFGILALKVIEIGLIMPPFGVNVFVSAGVNNMPPHMVFRQILPFAALDLGVTALLFAFPDIVLWLPRVAGYP
jgi:C4-dicarboxylate transporter DctM subunit